MSMHGYTYFDQTLPLTTYKTITVAFEKAILPKIVTCERISYKQEMRSLESRTFLRKLRTSAMAIPPGRMS